MVLLASAYFVHSRHHFLCFESLPFIACIWGCRIPIVQLRIPNSITTVIETLKNLVAITLSFSIT